MQEVDKREVGLVRPRWDYRQWHRFLWLSKSVTAVMCQRDTADVTRLGLESLLRFYPDLPIVIVDGGSKDDSINYLRYKAATIPNITLWERGGRNGHGTMLDDAIRRYVQTEYTLLLDNDIIVKRGGWIESMLEELQFSGSLQDYAIGTLMLVTDCNDGCGAPKDENDILRYAHPSCSIVNTRMYRNMKPFVEHGAPLVYNMQDAKAKGYNVMYFPIDKWVAHLSGASWTEPRTVWRSDINVMHRPFFTFIPMAGFEVSQFYHLGDPDYEVIFPGQPVETDIAIHDYGTFHVSNMLYDLRFKVRGEYVCVLSSNDLIGPDDFRRAKIEIIQRGAPEVYEMDELKFVKREVWQSRESIS